MNEAEKEIDRVEREATALLCAAIDQGSARLAQDAGLRLARVAFAVIEGRPVTAEVLEGVTHAINVVRDVMEGRANAKGVPECLTLDLVEAAVAGFWRHGGPILLTMQQAGGEAG